MPLPKICCPQCKGSGKVELPEALKNTLPAVNRYWQSTTVIHGKLVDAAWVTQTGLSNRLAALLKLGLVKCELHGRTKYWRRK